MSARRTRKKTISEEMRGLHVRRHLFREMRGIQLTRAIFNKTLEKCTSEDCLQWEKRDTRQTTLSEEMRRNMSKDNL